MAYNDFAGYKKYSTAEWHGKRDSYNKAVGGFATAKMSDGTYDYFPFGQPAQRNGKLDKGAKFIKRYNWNYGYWKVQDVK